MDMKWIPIVKEKMSQDCPLPKDGETVLITDSLGNVEVVTSINDWDDIKAWMPLPKPYKEKTQTEPPANWSGLWINRKEAMVWLTDCYEQYDDYQNEYDHGKHDAYYSAEDYISGMEGHD